MKQDLRLTVHTKNRNLHSHTDVQMMEICRAESQCVRFTLNIRPFPLRHYQGSLRRPQGLILSLPPVTQSLLVPP